MAFLEKLFEFENVQSKKSENQAQSEDNVYNLRKLFQTPSQILENEGTSSPETREEIVKDQNDTMNIQAFDSSPTQPEKLSNIELLSHSETGNLVHSIQNLSKNSSQHILGSSKLTTASGSDSCDGSSCGLPTARSDDVVNSEYATNTTTTTTQVDSDQELEFYDANNDVQQLNIVVLQPENDKNVEKSLNQSICSRDSSRSVLNCDYVSSGTSSATNRTCCIARTLNWFEENNNSLELHALENFYPKKQKSTSYPSTIILKIHKTSTELNELPENDKTVSKSNTKSFAKDFVQSVIEISKDMLQGIHGAIYKYFQCPSAGKDPSENEKRTENGAVDQTKISKKNTKIILNTSNTPAVNGEELEFSGSAKGKDLSINNKSVEKLHDQNKIPKISRTSKLAKNKSTLSKRQLELHNLRVQVEEKRLEILDLILIREKEEMQRDKFIYDKYFGSKSFQYKSSNYSVDV